MSKETRTWFAVQCKARSMQFRRYNAILDCRYKTTKGGKWLRAEGLETLGIKGPIVCSHEHRGTPRKPRFGNTFCKV